MSQEKPGEPLSASKNLADATGHAAPTIYPISWVSGGFA